MNLPSPPGLSYLPFQQEGIRFMLDRFARFRSSSSGVLLADSMGIGKTIQVLGVINADPSISRVLILCPAGLRLNWLHEGAKWLTRPFQWHVVGQRAKTPPIFAVSGNSITYGKNLPLTSELDSVIVIASYDSARNTRALGWPLMLMPQWDLVVADEAHFLKSIDSGRGRAVLGQEDLWEHELVSEPGLVHRGRRVLLLTGTPIPNRPIEIQPLLWALDSPAWPRHWFEQQFCGGVDRWGKALGACNLDTLRQRMKDSGMVLRRLKADVLKDLPPKTRQIVVLPANGAAVSIEAEREAFKHYEEAVTNATAEMEREAAHGTEESYEAAAARLDSTLHAAFNCLSALRHATALAKVPAVIEHISNALNDGADKLVVFGHHRDVLARIAAKFPGCVVINGETPVAQRHGLIEQFQTAPDCRVFIGAITAAGVGITLTAASRAVFAELDWVPGNVAQAEDRLCRIGQLNAVLIQHLVFDGSVDARMVHVILRKQKIAEKALDGRRVCGP